MHAAKSYLPLRSVSEKSSAPDAEQARGYLLRQGLLLLDTLLSQKEPAQSGLSQKPLVQEGQQ